MKLKKIGSEGGTHPSHPINPPTEHNDISIFNLVARCVHNGNETVSLKDTVISLHTLNFSLGGGRGYS